MNNKEINNLFTGEKWKEYLLAKKTAGKLGMLRKRDKEIKLSYEEIKALRSCIPELEEFIFGSLI